MAKKPSKMVSKYPGKCRVCHEKFPVGANIYWQKGVGAWHNEHGESPEFVSTKPAPPVKSELLKLGDPSALNAMFENAANHLKRPKIRIQVEGFGLLRLYRAGPQSKVPGSIQVCEDEWSGRWYGRLHTDGRWEPNRRMSERELLPITSMLAELVEDPEGETAKHGHLSGNCCFCWRRLTDERSVHFGYGGTCAKKWGMPWSKKAMTA